VSGGEAAQKDLQRFVWQTSENAFDTFPIHTQLPTWAARGQVFWQSSVVRFTPLHLASPHFFPYSPFFLPALFEFLARPTTFNDLARESQKVCCKYLTKNHPSGSAIIYLISFCVSQTLAKSSAQICNFYAHET